MFFAFLILTIASCCSASAAQSTDASPTTDATGTTGSPIITEETTIPSAPTSSETSENANETVTTGSSTSTQEATTPSTSTSPTTSENPNKTVTTGSPTSTETATSPLSPTSEATSDNADSTPTTEASANSETNRTTPSGSSEETTAPSSTQVPETTTQTLEESTKASTPRDRALARCKEQDSNTFSVSRRTGSCRVQCISGRRRRYRTTVTAEDGERCANRMECLNGRCLSSREITFCKNHVSGAISQMRRIGDCAIECNNKRQSINEGRSCGLFVTCQQGYCRSGGFLFGK